jgi:hypothetical protein
LIAQRCAHEVRSRASFQANERGLQVCSVGQQLRAGELLANDNLAVDVESNQMKCGFAKVNTDRSDVYAMILRLYAAA